MPVKSRNARIRGAVVIGILSGWGALSGAEEPRVWTDVEGRQVTGTLLEKDPTHVRVKINGRIHKLPILGFSRQDQEYISGADAFPTLRMDAKTVASSSRTSYDGGSDARRVSVQLANVAGRHLAVTMIWIGKEVAGNPIHAIQTISVNTDGQYFFDTVFDHPHGRLHDYRGFAVGVEDASGTWLTKAASLKPFEKILDEWKIAQQPKRPEPAVIPPQ